MHRLGYVLEILYRSREEVIARPEWFEPDSLDKVEKAILLVHDISWANRMARRDGHDQSQTSH